jgi:hypothetical protein
MERNKSEDYENERENVNTVIPSEKFGTCWFFETQLTFLQWFSSGHKMKSTRDLKLNDEFDLNFYVKHITFFSYILLYIFLCNIFYYIENIGKTHNK